ncbi:ATP-binding protein [soil metagenome]
MSKTTWRPPDPNPFATRFVRPGAIPYLFPPGDSLEQLLQRLRASGGWGQIIGPHGSGKSTLIAAMLPELQRIGQEPHAVRLRDGWTRPAWGPIPNGASLVVLDGFEQLSRWGRAWLRHCCQRRGLGLVVTAHEPIGLPDLFRTDVTPEMAWRVLQRLDSNQEPLLAPERVAERLAAQAGNLRELLFELYDLHEHRRRNLACRVRPWQTPGNSGGK